MSLRDASSASTRAAEEVNEMTSREIVEFFDRSRIRDLSSFRSLCNALKSQIMHEAVQIWKVMRSGRIAVLDLGCGRGGDLRKWASLRLKSYTGLDASGVSIEEARARHARLVAQGQSSLKANFHTSDVLTTPLELESDSIDIVSSMFFLQFSFCSKKSATLVLDEVARVLRGGGIFCCILPDGDMVHSLLSERKEYTSFGHFKLARCIRKSEASELPFGLSYNYALSSAGWCTEFLVSPRLLSSLLDERGLQPVFEGGSYFAGAQEMLSAVPDSQTVYLILRGQKCSQVDWLSLGFFKVLLARKCEPPSVTAESSGKI